MRSTRIALAFLLGLILVAIPSGAQAVTACYFAPSNNPNGPNYPQQREFIESQSWWRDDGTGDVFPGRHIHVATCFPFGQFGSTLSGTVHFDWRVMLHNQPTTTQLTHVKIQIVSAVVAGSPEIDIAEVADITSNNIPGDGYCTEPDGQCEWWFSANVNTALASKDGLQEFRFLTQVREDNGKEQYVTTGWQARLDNGKPYLDYRGTSPFIEARGWYTNLNYTVARLTTALPGITPRSGTWTTYWHLKPGSGGTPTTGYECNVDPNFHANPPNHGVQVLVSPPGAGQYVGTVSVDTTSLSNGTHTLVCRSDTDATVGSVSGTLSGVERISFNVQN